MFLYRLFFFFNYLTLRLVWDGTEKFLTSCIRRKLSIFNNFVSLFFLNRSLFSLFLGRLRIFVGFCFFAKKLFNWVGFIFYLWSDLVFEVHFRNHWGNTLLHGLFLLIFSLRWCSLLLLTKVEIANTFYFHLFILLSLLFNFFFLG